MSTRSLVRLPSVMRSEDRLALSSLGFRFGNFGAKFTLAELPAGWTERWHQTSERSIYADGQQRERIYVYPNATFTMAETETDEAPIQISLPAIRILCRFRLSKLGDPRFHVFDRLRGLNLSAWDSYGLAKAWLDRHYPKGDSDPLAHWGDIDQTPGAWTAS